MKENGDTAYQNLWATAKAGLKGGFIVINSYLKKSRQISNQEPNLLP